VSAFAELFTDLDRALRGADARSRKEGALHAAVTSGKEAVERRPARQSDSRVSGRELVWTCYQSSGLSVIGLARGTFAAAYECVCERPSY
jgi:hypothetical protein